MAVCWLLLRFKRQQQSCHRERNTETWKETRQKSCYRGGTGGETHEQERELSLILVWGDPGGIIYCHSDTKCVPLCSQRRWPAGQDGTGTSGRGIHGHVLGAGSESDGSWRISKGRQATLLERLLAHSCLPQNNNNNNNNKNNNNNSIINLEVKPPDLSLLFNWLLQILHGTQLTEYLLLGAEQQRYGDFKWSFFTETLFQGVHLKKRG